MKIAVVPGDGIGREVVPAALSVLDAFDLDIEKIPLDIGYGKWELTGSAITDEDIEILKECDCVIFGAITTPPDPGYKSVLVRIRKELDLYANIRPFTPLRKVRLPCARKFDFIIVRENTEGMYSGREELHEDAAYTTRVITRKGSERIAERACIMAKHGKKHITIVHKANVLKSDSFFRDICIGVAKKNGISYGEMLVDAMAYIHIYLYTHNVNKNVKSRRKHLVFVRKAGRKGIYPSMSFALAITRTIASRRYSVTVTNIRLPR